MLTYSLQKNDTVPLYEQLTRHIKEDITSGRISPGEKLPSRRSLARNLGISVITVETAYQQLMSEGYLESRPRRGCYAADISVPFSAEKEKSLDSLPEWDEPRMNPFIDLSGNETPRENFPFTAWARVSRAELSLESSSLVASSPGIGVRALREVIATHLLKFRGLHCCPEQIVIGAGTEYLYGLLIQLLGFDQVYGVEDPGYWKIPRIYESHGVSCRYIPLDDFSEASVISKTGADILHITPSHHFPTGRVMPIRYRNEILKWASCGKRYIIEDDYDSEFRFTGQPIPALFETDPYGCVIYLNTFTRTLASTVRISYMVLPPALMKELKERLSFYSCTVSNFEQYTLARFIREGFFERHINRMRNDYRLRRKRILQLLSESPLAPRMRIREEDAGLHFLLELDTALSDEELTARCRKASIRIVPLSVFYHDSMAAPQHTFLISYSSLSPELLPEAVKTLSGLLDERAEEKNEVAQ